MDVTSDTVTANNTLSGIKATKNDGTKITGNIASKSSSDLTASGATVTAPAGYYANAASKTVTTTTHPNPTASIASSTGVITASHTQGTGYVASGTTTGTLSLATQAGKTVTPTESVQTVVASYRWTTGPVSVAAISSTYIGTGIARKSAADLTVSGSNVTAPAGYYSSAVGKAVAAGSAFPPAVTITKNPTIGVNTSGVVTASYNGSSSITPTVTPGYVTTGTAGTVSTTGTSTYQLTSKAAATYYPSTADQTVASQRWLVGNQTFKSVTTQNLTADNIKSGTVVRVGDSGNASRIAQVTGTYAPNLASLTVTPSTETQTFNGMVPFKNLGKVSGDTASGTTLTIPVDLSDITYGETYHITCDGIKVANGSQFHNTIKIDTDWVASANGEVIFTYDSHSGNWDINKITLSKTALIITYSYNQHGISFTNEQDDGIHDFIISSLCDGYKPVTVEAVPPNNEDAIIQRTLSGIYSNSRITKIGSHAFDTCPDLTSVNFPKCTHIGTAAFAYCYNLSFISFPECTEINTRAFEGCLDLTSITSINFPKLSKIQAWAFSGCSGLNLVSLPLCEIIYASAFYGCSYLTSVNFPKCSIISYNTFQNCSRLVSVSFPTCVSIDTYAFQGCNSLSFISFPSCVILNTGAFYRCLSLTSANFPVCTSIGAWAFSGCSNLASISFPACTSIDNSAFYECSYLTTASFPVCSIIGSMAFYRCYRLLSLYLLSSFVVHLYNANAFYSTPISASTTYTDGTYGSIFVPKSLYDSYLTADNWRQYSSRFVSV